MTPLLLLDVDGVLNALADDGEHEDAWPEWQRGRAQADGSSWPILWAPAVVRRLRYWHETGLIEIQWMTTRETASNLGQALGDMHVASGFFLRAWEHGGFVVGRA